MNKRALAIAYIIIISLAGCTGGTLLDGKNATGTSSPVVTSKTPADSTTQATTTIDKSNVVQYRDLPPESKQIFEWTVENGSLEGVTEVKPQRVRPLFVNDYVKRNGDVYEVRSDRQMKSTYVVMGVEKRNQSTIENDSIVVNHSGLNESEKISFRSVLNDSDSTISYAPSEYPFPGTPADTVYVYYRGSYYEIDSTFSDTWSYRFSIEKVE